MVTKVIEIEVMFLLILERIGSYQTNKDKGIMLNGYSRNLAALSAPRLPCKDSQQSTRGPNWEQSVCFVEKKI